MKNLFVIIGLLSLLTIGCKGENDKDTVIMTVASEKGSCFLVGEFPCYIVKTPDMEGWHTIVESIRDFDYTPGYEYVIEAKRLVKENPPQDWLGEYQMIRLISKVQKQSEDLPSPPDWYK